MYPLLARQPRAASVAAAAAVEFLESRTFLTAVTSFSLVNADTGGIIGPLADGAMIDFAQIGTRNLSVIANADSTTSTVRFGYDANANYANDKSKPFTLTSYTKGKYAPWTPSTGEHTLSATPSTGKGRSTEVGPVHAVSFKVTDGVQPPPPVNSAPAVSLINPLGGNYAGLGFHLVRAAASDSDGSIARVEFYANGALIGATTTAPYMTSWRDVPVGTYQVTAKAFDNQGASTISAAVPVTIVAPQGGFTYVVSSTGSDTNPGSAEAPLGTIAKAWSLATAGDTILLENGTYYESLKLSKSGTAEKPIVIRARTPGYGNVVIDGTDPATGLKRDHILAPATETASSHVWLQGLTFRNAANLTGNHNAAVRAGTGWRVEDCTVELTAGVGLAAFGSNITLLRVVGQDNGCAGIGGTRVRNSLMLDCISRRNNTGNFSGGTEAGGGKFTRVNGLLVDNFNSYENRGPGLWFDYNNIIVTVRNSTLHHNVSIFNTDGSYRSSGIGLFFEISGVVEKDGTEVDRGELRAENNRAYDNDRYGISVYASANVTLTGNTLTNNPLELKDGRPAPFGTRNLTIVDNFFKNSRLLADSATTQNYQNENFIIDSNTYDNADGRLWRWNGVAYSSLAAIYNDLGFEKNGRIASVS